MRTVSVVGLAVCLAACSAEQGGNAVDASLADASSIDASSIDASSIDASVVDAATDDDASLGDARPGGDAGVDGGVLPVCAQGDVLAALAEAAPGTTVVLRAGCRIDGPLVVPPGVTLAGEGPESVLDGGDTGPAIEIAEGTGSVVRDLRINVLGGGWAIRATGEGDATFRGVRIHISRGAGIALRDRARVRLSSVKIDGPMSAGAAETMPTTQDQTGTWAVVAIDVGDEGDATSGVHVDDLDLSGLAVGGLSVERSVLEVIDTDAVADADDLRGMVVSAVDSEVHLEGVEVTDLFAGNGVPAIAVSAVAGSRARIDDLTVTGGAGYAVFADTSDVEIDGLVAPALGEPAVQVQGGTLVARGLALTGGDGAAVVALDASRVEVTGSMLSSQVLAPVPSTAGAVSIGDGIQIRRTSASAPSPAIVLTDVALEDNARAGLLVDLAGGAPASVSLTNVRARAMGSAFGVVAQRASMPVGWDSGVARLGTAAVNDGTFASAIDALGIIMPPAIAFRPSF